MSDNDETNGDSGDYYRGYHLPDGTVRAYSAMISQGISTHQMSQNSIAGSVDLEISDGMISGHDEWMAFLSASGAIDDMMGNISLALSEDAAEDVCVALADFFDWDMDINR